MTQTGAAFLQVEVQEVSLMICEVNRPGLIGQEVAISASKNDDLTTFNLSPSK
jgi:hypothetical protein